MGEYAYFKVNDIPVYALKNEATTYPFLMEVFSPDDFIDIPEEESEDEDNFNFGYVGYKTTARNAKDRLEICGYTLTYALNEVRELCSSTLDILSNPPRNFDEEDIEALSLDDDGNSLSWPELGSVLLDDAKLLTAFQQVFANADDTMKTWHREYHKQGKILSPVNSLAKYILITNPDDILRSIPTTPCPNPLCILRIVLEVVPDTCGVEYDFTLPVRLWDWGINDGMADYLQETAFSPSTRVILLTEGKTDDEFIKDALELLRPSVAHMFKFFDCHQINLERSSSALGKVSEAIISMNLQERFIFLFDNDAAGICSLDKLPSKERLPPNMSAVHLPDLELTKSYPSLGPDGPSYSDLNGRAVAIEFFLGKTALTNENGTLRPIVWSGRQKKTYQGGLDDPDKAAAQEAFRKAVREARENGIESTDFDWSNMEILLDFLIETASKLSPIIYKDARLFSVLRY